MKPYDYDGDETIAEVLDEAAKEAKQFGSLKLPFGFVSRVIAAGPYRNKPAGFLGIKCAAEINTRDYALKLDIRDFGLPRHPQLVEEALRFTLDRMAEGLPLYVGCMGGQGRTGLFLALLAKSLGVKEPIQYVREHYNPHAVETPEQEAYVEQFGLTNVKKYARKAKHKAFWHSFFGLFGIKPKY